MRSTDENPKVPLGVKPLTPRDYQAIRRGLLLEFWGLLYFPLLSLLLVFLGSSQPLWPVFLSGVCYLLVLAGLIHLLRVCEDGTFRLLLGLAASAYLVSGALAWACQLGGIPKAFEGASGLLFSGAALMFVLGLKRLVSQTHWWEGVLLRLRTDVLLVATFWVGWDVLVVSLTLSSGRARTELNHPGALFLIFVARIVTLVRVWRTLKSIHQDAGLRNNVLVIRNRRRRGGMSAEAQPRGVPPRPSSEEGRATPPEAGA